MQSPDYDLANVRVTVCVRDINTARVKTGVPLGPCLLTPGMTDVWTIGRWNGDGWFDGDGLELHPTLWALLPNL